MTDTRSSEKQGECPECGGKVIEDPQKAELVCTECDRIVEEDMIDHGPEWRSFNYDEEEQKSRTGSPTTKTMHDKGLTTNIDWKDKDAKGNPLSQRKRRKMHRVRKAQRRSKTKDPREDNLQFALGEIDRMCDALNLPDRVQETASMIYRRALDEDLIRGRSIEGAVGASVYIACLQEGLPRSLSEIEKPSRVSEKEIGRTRRDISRELKLEIQPPDPAEYVPRFCSKLGLSSKVESNAISIIRNTEEISSGKSPTGFAAAAIYLASLRSGSEKTTQKELAEVADVTEVTVRNRYQEQFNLLETKLDNMLEQTDYTRKDLYEGKVSEEELLEEVRENETERVAEEKDVDVDIKDEDDVGVEDVVEIEDELE